MPVPHQNGDGSGAGETFDNLDSRKHAVVQSEHRIKILQGKIEEAGLSAALLFYSRDVFYYTGTAQPSYLVVLPGEHFLFVRSGFEFALKDAFISKERIREKRDLQDVYKEAFPSSPTNNRIGTELDILLTNQFHEFKKTFVGYEFVNVSPIVLEQRKRKDAYEIDKIKEACDVVNKGHDAVMGTLREGVTELELAAAVEHAHRLAGHEGVCFVRQPDFFMSRGPLSSGANLFKVSGVVYTITGVGLSPSVPVGPSRRRISKRDPVIVDIPVLVNGYHADQTRTYVLGKANHKIKAMYDSLKEIADYLIEYIKPPMKCSEIYEKAVAKAQELGVMGSFLSFGAGKKSRMIGHGIGLELNEPPTVSEYDDSEVPDGLVIALDMHMMDEHVGVVKLEDMVLITKEGNEVLTKSPRHLSEL